jgi:hypothetical protein
MLEINFVKIKKIILMYFIQTENTLKNNLYHNSKHHGVIWYCDPTTISKILELF